ncbi:hypothetical protein ACE41A_08030 [Bacillus cytotoxicus]|nr:hypothetical protein [Bacillus cytotoxicus]MDH2880028.1 hypothetical protein [Bacillus cytotoxicus]
MSLKELGTLKMTGNTIFVSNPCYPIKTSVADSGYTEDEDLSLILTPAK